MLHERAGDYLKLSIVKNRKHYISNSENNMHYLANTGKFLRISDFLAPWLYIGTLLLFITGLYYAFFASPPDYQQGITVRIMYIHVPSAWMSLFIYSLMSVMSASFLIWKLPLADIIARNSAKTGAVFAFLTLATGSIWGKPMWGTWWVWDARLTSMLILFFLYIGYLAMAAQAKDKESLQKICAITAIIGFINIPIIKFSVDWWATLHQPASVFRASGPSIDPSMLTPLILMALAFAGFYKIILLMDIKAEILGRRTKRQRSRMKNK